MIKHYRRRYIRSKTKQQLFLKITQFRKIIVEHASKSVREFSKIFADERIGLRILDGMGRSHAICRWRKRREPFKALCYPWQAPEGHSYLPAAVCFADLNRVTFAVRNGPGEFLHRPVIRRDRGRKGE